MLWLHQPAPSGLEEKDVMIKRSSFVYDRRQAGWHLWVLIAVPIAILPGTRGHAGEVDAVGASAPTGFAELSSG